MTPEQFYYTTGRDPENDDLERVNCPQGGELGHEFCGVCQHCNYPRFVPRFDAGVLVCNHRTITNQLNHEERS